MHAWQGGVRGGEGACIAAGDCVVGEMATEAGGTLLTGMHRCYFRFVLLEVLAEKSLIS